MALRSDTGGTICSTTRNIRLRSKQPLLASLRRTGTDLAWCHWVLLEESCLARLLSRTTVAQTPTRSLVPAGVGTLAPSQSRSLAAAQSLHNLSVDDPLHLCPVIANLPHRCHVFSSCGRCSRFSGRRVGLCGRAFQRVRPTTSGPAVRPCARRSGRQADRQAIRGTLQGDRKSTRLNSSH